MSGNGWLRICIHATLTFMFAFIMYNNLQNWSNGQTNIAFSSSSAAKLPFPSITVCPYKYPNGSHFNQDIEAITREDRLLILNHDRKLVSNLCSHKSLHETCTGSQKQPGGLDSHTLLEFAPPYINFFPFPSGL